MKANLLIWGLIAVLGTGCALMETIAGNLTSPSGKEAIAGGVEAAAPAIPAVVEKAVEGTSWEDRGLGAIAAGILGMAVTLIGGRQKEKRKRTELWDAVTKLKNGNNS